MAGDVPGLAAATTTDTSEETEGEGRPKRLSKVAKAAKIRDLELEDWELKVELKKQKIQTEKEAQETLRYSREMMRVIVEKYGNEHHATKAVNSLASVASDTLTAATGRPYNVETPVVNTSTVTFTVNEVTEDQEIGDLHEDLPEGAFSSPSPPHM